MRDRLIELISQVQYIGGLECRLADYLLKNGVIVPKVKIGDSLYAINAARTRVKEYYVTHLEVYDCGVKIFGRPIYCREEYWLCWSQDLGNHEWVHFTREEAERALERREG